MKDSFIVLIFSLSTMCGAYAASDVTISTAATSGGSFTGTNPNVFTPTAASAVANNATIQTGLNGGSAVTVNTASSAGGSGNLTVASAIAKTAGASSTLTLNAARDLVINGALSSTTGALPLILNAGRNMSNSQALTSNGGSITLNPAQVFVIGAPVNAGTGQVALQTGSIESSSSQTLTASSVQVASTAALRLQGTVAGSLSVAGTVSPAPAGGTGSLQVNGTATLQSTSTTVIDLGGTSQGITYDRINATGAVTVAGNLQVNLVNNFHDTINGSTVFTVLQGSSLTGTFAGYPNGSRITLSNDYGSLRVNYTATAVTLDDWKPVIVNLTWDPGSAEAGTDIFSNTNTRAGRHYFRIMSQSTDIGAWRTRLTVAAGEAALYMSKTSLPTIGSSQYNSVQTGSDGFVLRGDQFGNAEEWFILVNAASGAQWSLFSGRAYVHDLGQLPFTDGNSNAQYDIGEAVAPQSAPAAPMPPEGIRFYKSTVPTGTPAWSLWLNGSTWDIAVRKNFVPFHTSSSYYERKQTGQMLVVSPYLQGLTSTYYLSVVAPKGEVVGLDSRIQEVIDIGFDTTTANTAVNAAPYRVYRVQVPVQQIAWEVRTTPTSGNPNVCIRRSNVGAEFDNDAFSEVGGSARDSVTLVPDFLSDGTWYITVYGSSGYGFSLRNGSPTITDIQFTDSKINDETERAGWRYYKLSDLNAQLGSQGWELELANHKPGTEIAVRRNAVPSRWNYRTNGSTTVATSNRLDASSAAGFLQRPGHQADIWYIGIYTPGESLGAFNLNCQPLQPSTVSMDRGVEAVANIAPGRWRYHRVEVPAGVLGWDLRLRDVSGPLPAMVVRRDLLPASTDTTYDMIYTYSGNPRWRASWPSGNQLQAGSGNSADWTRWANNPGTGTAPPRTLMAMGRPLEAGTYYVGVYNSSTTQTTSYTLDSRGVGTAGSGLTYEAASDLTYAGGTATISNLAPREARYFKVTIPAGTPSWELELEPTAGEMMLKVRSGALPDFSSDVADIYVLGGGGQKTMKKVGSERFVMLPSGQSTIPAGDYYLAVISEGANPGTPSNTIGTGTSSGTLRSLGPLVVTDLGVATPDGLNQAVSLVAGQVKAFTFTVPVGTQSLEARFETTSGAPRMKLTAGSLTPDSPFSSAYGISGGAGGTEVAPIYTLANPQTGTWSVLVHGPQDAPSTANLVFRQKQNLPLNFASELNGGGGTHSDSRQMIDSEYQIYSVAVPSSVAGQPVVGWIIEAEASQGAVSLEIYKNFAAPSSGAVIAGGYAVIVPPLLTFEETWYVRVKATGLTSYTITSKLVTLERPAWQMPPGHNTTFGDSGIAANGMPLPGDQGADLERGKWHFYAVDVPEGNAGLLRTELQAISGNPDLYIREDGVPTNTHDSNGAASGGSTLYHRSLTASISEYGNWVPLDGRTERQLKPGRWYLGVKATGGANARYRLIASTGQVTDLALNGGSVTNQTLVGSDWRYYRFTVPQDAPNTWSLTFSQQVGDVNLWLRDTVPPGSGDDGLDSSSSNGLESWQSDTKNQGPYSTTGHDAAGTYNFTTPPLRPGHTYYAGFRAANDATFSFSTATSGGTIGSLTGLDYYTGAINTSVPAGGSVLYQITVPPEATRMKWTATHSSSVQMRLEQGTLPGISGTQHWTSGSSANVAFNQALSSTSWPWQPDQKYYLRVMNTSGSAQNAMLTMNGKNAATEDEDTDGLPDAWEKLYFTSTTSHNGVSDPDGDGVTNAVELTDGTIPNDVTSAKYFLTVTPYGGNAITAPIQAKYDRGTIVTLTDTPHGGTTFVGWQRVGSYADDFAIRISADVIIPADGTYTFGINAADGGRLKINGITVIIDNTTHAAADRLGEITLTAGTYPLLLEAFEYTGGEALELFAATGSHTSFNSSFKLVGDTASSGLGTVSGFSVQQVIGVGTGNISSLTRMDELLAGTRAKRAEVSLIVPTINYLGSGSAEGRYAGSANFPLQQPETTNPLPLGIFGDYTMAALNSLPLTEAVDAPAMTFVQSGNAPWLGESSTLAQDNVDHAGSGPITHGQSSSFSTTVVGPGTLTFRWKVSSEATNDQLQFLVNGTVNQQISGEQSYSLVTYAVAAGTQTLTWRYNKNASVSSGSDRGWVDQINFAQTRYTLTVNASGGTVIASPQAADYVHGTVVTLTATPNAGNEFTGWSGTLTGSANPASITMDANKNITASFGLGLPTVLETPAQTYTLGGNVNWFGQMITTHDTVDAAQSGGIGHSQQSWMETTITGPGNLSFWWKVSSESGYDYLEFYIDGTLQTGRISGNQDWQQKTYVLAAGSRTLRWRYTKDGSGVSGSDAAWVDELVFVSTMPQPPVATTLAATTVANTSAALNGTVNPSSAATTVSFEYGLAPDALVQSTPEVVLASGNSTSPHSHGLTGLPPDTTYHYRLKAVNSEGTRYGEVLSFRTTGAADIVLEQTPGLGMINGASVNFGATLLSTNTPRAFTLRNGGAAALTGLAASLTGTDAASFELLSPLPSTLSGGASTTLTVRFVPGSIGDKVALLSIVSNDVDENPFTVNLTGFGTLAAPEIVVEHSGSLLVDGSAAVDYGVLANGGMGSQTFTIRNTGNAPLTGLSLGKTGDHAGDFMLGALSTTTLAQDASTTFTVTFSPSGGGIRTAALQITSNDVDENPFDIVLTGVAPIPGGNVADNFDDNVLNTVMWLKEDYTEQGTLTESSKCLNYTATVETFFEPGFPSIVYGEGQSHLVLLSSQPSSTEDWEVMVDVTNSAAAAARNFWEAGAILEIYDTSHPTNGNRVSLELGAFNSGTDEGTLPNQFGRTFVGGLMTDGSDDPETDDELPATGTNTTGVLRVAFNAGTKVFTLSVDRSGPANGLQWETVATYGIAGTGGSRNADWGMTNADTFQIHLVGLSMNVAVTSGQVTFDNFKLTRSGVSPPAITQQPASRTIISGQSTPLSVGTSGFSLGYQWYAGVTGDTSQPIAGARGAIFTTPALTAQASYWVRVSNSLGSEDSDTVVVSISTTPLAPTFATQPLSQLAMLGQTLTYNLTVTGSNTLTYQWRKGTTNITNAKTNSLTLVPLKTSDAGLYSLRATNGVGTKDSDTAYLGVVTRGPSAVGVNIGTTLTLNAVVTVPAGTSARYLWYQDGVALSNGGRRSGVDAKTLKITGAVPTDAGNYTCQITMVTPVGDVFGNNADTVVSVVEKPVFDAVDLASNFGDVRVGQGIDFTITADNSPTKFIITGLPAGVKLDAATGRIYGVPIAAKQVKGVITPYTLKISASNTAGTSDVETVLWTVQPLYPSVIGTYNGLVVHDPVNQDLGGTLKLTVASTAALSGMLKLGALSYTLVGSLNFPGINDNAVGHIVIPRKAPLTTLLIAFELNKDTGELTGSVEDNLSGPAELTAWRAPWSSTNKADDYVATYNTALDPAGGDGPEGYGFMPVKVTNLGAVSWTGKLADGTGITGSTTLGPDGQIAFQHLLYANTGSIQGWMTIDDETGHLDGVVHWFKAEQSVKSTTRSYKGGFVNPSVTVIGAPYIKPAAAVLDLPTADLLNAKVTLLCEGTTDFPSGVEHLFTITDKNVVTPDVDNLLLFKLTLAATTGTFGGSMTLFDQDPSDFVEPFAMIKRTVNYTGILVTREDFNHGVGHFIVDDLPFMEPIPDTDPPRERRVTATPQWSGSVIFSDPSN